MKIIKFLLHPCFVSLLATYFIGSVHTAIIALIVTSYGIYTLPNQNLGFWKKDESRIGDK